MSYNEIIAERRKSLGLSLRQLAELTGVNYKHINKIELGQISPTLDTLAKLLPHLGLIYFILTPSITCS